MNEQNKPGRIKKFFRNKRLWYLNKKALLKEFDKVTKIANINIRSVLRTLESLDQNKLYFLSLDADQQELMALKDVFDRAKQELKWTTPKIIFINKEIIKLTEQEMDEVMDELIIKYKKNKRGV